MILLLFSENNFLWLLEIGGKNVGNWNCKQCATATQKSPLMTFLMEKPSKNAAPCGISINATKQAGGAQRWLRPLVPNSHS